MRTSCGECHNLCARLLHHVEPGILTSPSPRSQPRGGERQEEGRGQREGRPRHQVQARARAAPRRPLCVQQEQCGRGDPPHPLRAPRLSPSVNVLGLVTVQCRLSQILREGQRVRETLSVTLMREQSFFFFFYLCLFCKSLLGPSSARLVCIVSPWPALGSPMPRSRLCWARTRRMQAMAGPALPTTAARNRLAFPCGLPWACFHPQLDPCLQQRHRLMHVVYSTGGPPAGGSSAAEAPGKLGRPHPARCNGHVIVALTPFPTSHPPSSFSSGAGRTAQGCTGEEGTRARGPGKSSGKDAAAGAPVFWQRRHQRQRPGWRPAQPPPTAAGGCSGSPRPGPIASRL